MPIHIGNQALTNVKYVVDQDGAVEFTSTILDLRLAIASVSYQIKWDAGVLGQFIWEASIYPDPFTWEPLVSCEEVEFTIQPSQLSSIISLPKQWYTVGYIRWRFEPFDGSAGLINAAIRIVPI